MSAIRRARWWIVAAALVAAIAGFAWAPASQDEGAWAEVRRGALVVGVEVTGTLRATETSSLGPPQVPDTWEYKISQLAPEGQQVEAGTPVVAFDDSVLRQNLEQQLAERDSAVKQIEKTRKTLEMTRSQDELRLAEARARLRKARLALEVPEQLVGANELRTSRLDLELAEHEVAWLEARLEASDRSARAQLAALDDQRRRAEQRVAELEAGIADMVRTAPRAGTVIYVSDWRGEKKKVGDGVWRGDSVLELPDLRSMLADGQVDEADAGRVAEGQGVTLRLDAHPDVEFEGRVDSIWRTVRTESWRSPVKVVRLEIGLAETDTQRMRPGMRFRGRVEVERVEDVLLVPLAAVFPTDAGPVVYRRSLLGHEPVSVELGRRDADSVEVVSGLEAGDEVSLVDLEARG